MDFNKLNADLYQLSANYRFSKDPQEFERGYLKISDWLADLCFHFEQRRKNQELSDENEFKEVVESYKVKIEELEPSKYRDGLLKAIKEV
ncbi:MAG: hypothetical protein ABFQ64_08245 [Campylobacterota bacterium]